MPAIKDLEARIDKEFSAVSQKVKDFQAEALEQHKGRQERYKTFLGVLERVREIAKPRIEALIKRFPKVTATPKSQAKGREVSLSFQTDLAMVRLKFAASHDTDIHNLLLEYRLEILPIFIKFEPHSLLEMPIDAIDEDAIASWIDDRIVSFAQTYAAMHFHEQYQKGKLVRDPIIGVEFPKQFAAVSIERDGQTYYFLSDETRQEFETSSKK